MLTDSELFWINQHIQETLISCQKLNQAVTNDVFLLAFSNESQFVFKRLNAKARTSKDRLNEALVHQQMFKAGLSSKLIASNAYYFLQEYIVGQPFGNDDINREMLKVLSAQLSRVHRLSINISSKQSLSAVLLDLQAQQQLKNKSLHDFNEYFQLAQKLDTNSDFDCFCHGDLSFLNLIESTDKSIFIIDWEYAISACRAYDVGSCCAINVLNLEQTAALIDFYFRENALQIEQTKTVFEEDCQSYYSLFIYINKCWKQNLGFNAYEI